MGNITTHPSPVFIQENFEQLSMSEDELKEKKVGVLGLGFPVAWRDESQLEAAMKDTTPGKPDETIRGSPVILIVVYGTRKRAPASEGDVLGMISLGCLMENMWLMAQSLGVGFQIMSGFSGPVQEDVRRILKIPRNRGISFAVRLGYPAGQPGSCGYAVTRPRLPPITSTGKCRERKKTSRIRDITKVVWL